MNITIDDELASLLIPLTEDQLAGLEESIRQEGCRDPFAVWVDGDSAILLDGHARLPICRRLSIPFTTMVIDLPDRQAACGWRLATQLGRRNLPPIAVSYYRGQLYISMSAREGQKVPGRSSQPIAERFGVNEKTIRRDAELARALDALADLHGADFRTRVLTRSVQLTRTNILHLARQNDAGHQTALQKKGSRRRGRESTPPPGEMSVPFAPNATADTHDEQTLRQLVDLWRRAGHEARKASLQYPLVRAAIVRLQSTPTEKVG